MVLVVNNDGVKLEPVVATREETVASKDATEEDSDVTVVLTKEPVTVKLPDMLTFLSNLAGTLASKTGFPLLSKS